MKIAYVLHRRVTPEDGVIRKITTQVRHWRRTDDVRLFAMAPAPAGGSPLGEGAFVCPYETLAGRFAAARLVADAVGRWAPDLIYLRYSSPYPPLASLVRRIPAVVEMNSLDEDEARAVSLARYAFNRAMRAGVLRPAAGFVCIAHEIAASPGLTRFGKPTLVLGNGIEVESVPPVPPNLAPPPRLIFLGVDRAPWQGVDKVLELARLLPETQVDLVGIDQGHGDADWPANAAAHGFLTAPGYAALMCAADVGIGTLALHRKRMQENSPLKTREYLAAGLPVITAYDDIDFPDRPDFILQLPNTEDNVRTHVGAIRAFIDRTKGTRVPRSAVLPRIDAAAKERTRLSFMRQCLAATGLEGRRDGMVP